MFKAIILSGLVALSAAQSSVLTFTHVPNPVTDGQAQAITFSTNDTTIVGCRCKRRLARFYTDRK